MRLRVKLISLTVALLFIGSIGAAAVSAQQPSSASEAQDLAAGLNPNPPSAPVRCVFIHHQARSFVECFIELCAPIAHGLMRGPERDAIRE